MPFVLAKDIVEQLSRAVTSQDACRRNVCGTGQFTWFSAGVCRQRDLEGNGDEQATRRASPPDAGDRTRRRKDLPDGFAKRGQRGPERRVDQIPGTDEEAR